MSRPRKIWGMSRFTLLPMDRLKDYEQKIREESSYLLDVREKGEYDAGHIPLAMSRPLSQLEAWSGELDKERTVIIYCRTINRARGGPTCCPPAGIVKYWCLTAVTAFGAGTKGPA